jgi:hypothetical protein
MTAALPIDVDGPARRDGLAHGVVCVYNHGFGHLEAVCSCGWTGRRRHLKAVAIQDAWVHSMHENGAVSFPLVIPTAGIA